MLAPIVTTKHFVQQVKTFIAGGVIANLPIIEAVAVADVDLPQEIQEGSVIKAVYIEMWICGKGSLNSSVSFNITLEKVPAQATLMTAGQSLTLMSYPNKKNILYTSQGQTVSQIAGPTTPIMRQFFPIPKGKQRFGLGDRLILNLSDIDAEDLQFCGLYIFKEYK